MGMINPMDIITQRVNVTQQVTISQDILVRLSLSIGLNATDTQWGNDCPMGFKGRGSVVKWYVCVLRAGEGSI
jgi:hypothetical protein